MKLDDVKEWMQIADDDFDSAEILNEAVRKHCEVICYLCAQAVEKYLKAFLTHNDIIPEKTHNLPFLNGLCLEKSNDFQSTKQLCDFLNRFAVDIRYPHKYSVTETDAHFCINSVEKIRNLPIMIDIRNISTKIADDAQHTETHTERVKGGL
jgi:HEPN domain-containing protein